MIKRMRWYPDPRDDIKKTRFYTSQGGKTAFGETEDCCCPGVPCCGRSLPGEYSTEGPLYYPLNLYVRFSPPAGCACNTPVTFIVTWEFSPCYCWRNDGPIDMGPPCDAPPCSCPLTDFYVICADDGYWRGGFKWGNCNLGNLITFQLTMVLNEVGTGTCNVVDDPDCTGTCDPVDGEGTAFLPQGLNCCGNIFGPDMYATIELYE